ncbi:MAG: stage II sporulation protein M, partial [Myxococcales bacterium]|nr:stage II sporulation protein M [Myxococcales bacterium]
MSAQDDLVTARQDDWRALEALVSFTKHTHKRPPHEIAEIAGLYRSVCSDLMRARALGCQLDLIAHLDGLTARAH